MIKFKEFMNRKTFRELRLINENYKLIKKNPLKASCKDDDGVSENISTMVKKIKCLFFYLIKNFSMVKTFQYTLGFAFQDKEVEVVK